MTSIAVSAHKPLGDTPEAIRRHIGNLGDAQPMMVAVIHGDVTLTFTKDGLLLSTNNLVLLEQIKNAKEVVGNHVSRINSMQ